MTKRLKILKKYDAGILLPALFLITLGLILQFSIKSKTVGVDLEINLTTQIVSIILGFIAAESLLFFSMDFWKKAALPAHLIAIILLGLVLFLGTSGGGSQRWIDIGSFQLQPTELAKISLIFFLANILNTHYLRANSFRLMSISALAFILPAGLIVMQPDLGSAVVLGVIWLATLLTSRIKLSRFALILTSILAGAVLLVPFLAEYQQQRLVSYFNPSKDVSGASYNVNQSQIAIGSGGLFGNGLEAGSQSQLNFLPSQHTDFIFSVIAEKLGLVGAGICLVALLFLLIRMLYLAYSTTSQYKRLILVGSFALLGFHSAVNIGMTMGLVPVTGLPLPYLSYGGTFMFSVVLITIIAARINTKTN